MDKIKIAFKKNEIEKIIDEYLIREGLTSEDSLKKLVGNNSSKSIRTPEEIMDRRVNNQEELDLNDEVNNDAQGMDDAEDDALAPEELIDVLESLDSTLSLLSKAAVRRVKNEKQKDKLFKIYSEINKLKTNIIKENNISH